MSKRKAEEDCIPDRSEKKARTDPTARERILVKTAVGGGPVYIILGFLTSVEQHGCRRTCTLFNACMTHWQKRYMQLCDEWRDTSRLPWGAGQLLSDFPLKFHHSLAKLLCPACKKVLLPSPGKEDTKPRVCWMCDRYADRCKWYKQASLESLQLRVKTGEI